MKRIVFLSGSGVLKEGGEFSLVDIIKGIKHRYKILCICKNKGPLSDILENLKIKVIFCDLKWSRKFKYIFTRYRNLIFLYFKIKNFKPGLIYSNSGRVNPFAAKLAKALKIPLITHVRDIFDEVTKDKYCFRQSNKIIAISKNVANLIKFNQNIKVIYNGVDPKKFFPGLRFAEDGLRKRLNLNGKFLVGNVGTIAYRKGYFEFAEAAKEIVKAIPSARFLVIGETLPGRNYIREELERKIEEAGLKDNFIFTGFVKEVAKTVASLDVLLFPPRYEAFGRVIIEALACGVPVVSTYSGGPEEIIESKKSGLLVKAGDIKSMADAVIRLYQNRNLYTQISKSGYKRFRDKFSIGRTIGEICAIIDETINRRG